MTCFADTSFLLSLVAQDAHTAPAKAWRGRSAALVMTTDLAVFEAENALRNLQLRGGMDEKEAASARLAPSTLILGGFIVPHVVRPRLLTAEARRLAAHFSPGVPHGRLDVLHVAAARVLKADTLATFDKNQRALAESAGLKVVP